MFSLKELLPNEKKENDEQLINKYKDYSMEYLNYKREKVTKKIKANAMIIYGIIFVEFLYLFATLISGKEISNDISKLASDGATNFSNETVANVFIASGEFNIWSGVVYILCILGAIYAAYLFFMICTKHDKEREFYDSVIDIKMDEKKLE